MKKAILIHLYFLTISLYGQPEYQLHLKDLKINGFPKLQSFVWGQWDGEWILMGGRQDGLHRRQPNTSFDQNGQTDSIWVVNPGSGQIWGVSVNALPAQIKEPLLSTNIQFIQDKNFLFLVGGYGYSVSRAAHITYGQASRVNLPDLVKEVKSGNLSSNPWQQIQDSRFSVTGGRLEKIGTVFYLAGGHLFNGRYNPMGGPSFTQIYTDAVRRFIFKDSVGVFTVNFLTEWHNPSLWHRRDYNVIPQIFSGGKIGYTAFSGVFQPQANLPWLTAIHADSNGYSLDTLFKQYYHQYHSGFVPLYDSIHDHMWTYFLGGMSEYHDSSGILVHDLNVPFVKTISCIQNQNGKLSEFLLKSELPGFYGAGAEVIPASHELWHDHRVFMPQRSLSDSVLAGYLVGGIFSTLANIFWINTGNESVASDKIFEIWMVKNKQNPIAVENKIAKGKVGFQLVRNSNSCSIFPFGSEKYTLEIFNLAGQLLHFENIVTNQSINWNYPSSGGVFLIKLSDPNGNCYIEKTIF